MFKRVTTAAMQNRASLLAILRTHNPNELLRLRLQALIRVHFVAFFLVLYPYFVLAVEYHWGQEPPCCMELAFLRI